MASQPFLVSRRRFLSAMSLGVAGSVTALHDVRAFVPKTNARTQPSAINVVLYDDKTDVDRRLFPLQQGRSYSIAIRGEGKVFHAFHIANARNKRLITIPNVGPGQTVSMKWKFTEAGEYTLINECLAGYLNKGGLIETKVTVEKS